MLWGEREEGKVLGREGRRNEGKEGGGDEGCSGWLRGGWDVGGGFSFSGCEAGGG